MTAIRFCLTLAQTIQLLQPLEVRKVRSRTESGGPLPVATGFAYEVLRVYLIVIARGRKKCQRQRIFLRVQGNPFPNLQSC